MSKTIHVAAAINLPSLPNFLRSEDVCLDVADVTDESLREIGAAWTDSLILHAQKRREERKHV